MVTAGLDLMLPFKNRDDPRWPVAVLMVDAGRDVLARHRAAREHASEIGGAVGGLAYGLRHGRLTSDPNAAANLAEFRAAAGAIEAELAALAAAEQALDRLVAAYEHANATRRECNRCTHAADCPVHPAATGEHNFDPPWC